MSSPKKSANPNWFKWGELLFNVMFFILVPFFFYLLIKNTHWAEVLEAFHQLEWHTLGLCIGITALSYYLYGSYDLLGRLYTGHKLPAGEVLTIGVVCYAFTLSLSHWVGGFALRFRLYSRLGLDTATITKIFSLTVITNWLGFMLVGGILFTLKLPELPPNWKIGETGLQVFGIILLLLAFAYLSACRFAAGRSWQIRDHKIVLPEFRVAVMQACLAIINWLLMALLVFVLLPEKVTFITVLGILLISGLAGFITHIPAGLGVLEAIFIGMLQHQFSHGAILAAIIGYRLVYFIIPLAITSIAYFMLERRVNLNKHNEKVFTSMENSGCLQNKSYES